MESFTYYFNCIFNLPICITGWFIPSLPPWLLHYINVSDVDVVTRQKTLATRDDMKTKKHKDDLRSYY